MAAGDQQPTPWVSGMNKRIMPSMTALQCFEAVARHMSFTLAAQDLNLTQSAISKQIAQLEALLHQPLFHRSPRALALTPAGRMYLAEVCSILNQVDASARYAMGYGVSDETLTIAVQPTFGISWARSTNSSHCRRSSSETIGGLVEIVETTETLTPLRCTASTSGRKSPSPENR